MTLQTFLMVQLGVLALGLGAAMGWRGWQMRRQMTLLTKLMSNSESLVVSTPPQPPVPEATAEEPAEDSVAQDEPADAATDSDFDDLDDLLDPQDADPHDTTMDVEPSTIETEPAAAEVAPEPKAEASEPATEESGLRALVTKFASENRQLLEQMNTLEAEVQRLEAAYGMQLDTAPDTDPEAVSTEETNADSTEAQTPEPAVEENGLRALVTKFGSENRQLLEQVHTLEAQIQRLEAAHAAQLDTEPDTDPQATSTEETNAASAEAKTPEPAEG